MLSLLQKIFKVQEGNSKEARFKNSNFVAQKMEEQKYSDFEPVFRESYRCKTF